MSESGSGAAFKRSFSFGQYFMAGRSARGSRVSAGDIALRSMSGNDAAVNRSFSFGKTSDAKESDDGNEPFQYTSLLEALMQDVNAGKAELPNRREERDEISVQGIAYRFPDMESIASAGSRESSDAEAGDHDFAAAVQNLTDKNIQAFTFIQKKFRDARLIQQRRAAGEVKVKSAEIDVAPQNGASNRKNDFDYRAFILETKRKTSSRENIANTTVHLERNKKTGSLRIVEVSGFPKKNVRLTDAKGGAFKKIMPTPKNAKSITFLMQTKDAASAGDAQKVCKGHAAMFSKNNLLAYKLNIFENGLEPETRLAFSKKIKGPDLSRILKETRINAKGFHVPASKALSALLRQIKAMHDDGLIHGDIKPANIVIKLEGPEDAWRAKNAYLIDFDFAADRDSRSLMRPGVTPTYMPLKSFERMKTIANDERVSDGTKRARMFDQRKINDQVAYLKLMLEASARNADELAQVGDQFGYSRYDPRNFFFLRGNETAEQLIRFYLGRFIEEQHIDRALDLLKNPVSMNDKKEPKLHLADMLKKEADM